MVELGNVNGGNKDHGTDLGITRDGGALFVVLEGRETEQSLEGGSIDGRSEE